MIALATVPTIEEILPEHHRQTLSPNAKRMYYATWIRMEHLAQTDIWMPDAEISRRSRVLLKDVAAAQSELARANLLFLVPGINQTQYVFIADPDSDEQADETP